MNFIVQKFGGTSLNSESKRKQARKNIIEEVQKDNCPVVVVSAMGREGQAYATDTLLELVENGETFIPERQKDLLLSCGEIISSVVMASELEKIDYQARSLTGWQAGITTDESFGSSRIIEVNPKRIIELWEKEIIPVVAGFQGISPQGEITTLGRGGSDTTASVLAYALEAERIDIYSDVKGFMTSDPKKCSEAKKLEKITYNEACELAYQGAKVVHPRAAEVAMDGEIPLNIRSVNSNGNNKGTTIDSKQVNIKSDKPATGIATRNDIIFIEIYPDNGKNYATGLKVFSLLAEEGISVDFINIRPEKASFVINNELTERAINIIEKDDFEFNVSSDYCKISVVGGGMTGQPGVMARIVEALCEAGIEIYQTTDSHTTISCLIAEEKEKKAVKALHNAFNLEEH